MLSTIKTRILRTLDYHVDRHKSTDIRDIRRELQRRALRESADLVSQSFGNARSFRSRDELLHFALSLVPRPIKGLCLEFGVYSGASINVIAQAISGAVDGFDSFEGLPEDWREGHVAGTFKVAALPEVRANVSLHKGWFSDTLPGYLASHPGMASFVHVDCDLYSSTKFVLDQLAGRLASGTILLFDEYFNYPGWQEGEHKAWLEYQEVRNVKFEYVGYNSLSEQVAIKIL